MKKKLFVLCILFLISYYSFSQGIGIGTTTPDASAALDITHTAKGLLIPRMSTAAINAITSPARGLLVYDSVTNQLMANTGIPAAPGWQPVASNSSGWKLNGNNSINAANEFIGTTDNQPLRFRINNIQAGELHPETGNVSWGLRANTLNTTGSDNIAIGTDALKLNKEGSDLVAIGDSALFNNGRDNPVPVGLAISNTAIGSKSLFSNTTGSSNTATGSQSLTANITGGENTATGDQSLFSNTIGVGNTATGYQSLFSNTGGGFNTAYGAVSLHANTVGRLNTAVGHQSLFSNTTGSDNAAFGSHSLFTNSTGNGNTAAGVGSLFANTTGDVNTATGNLALNNNTTGNFNTAVGVESLFLNLTGSANTAVGANALGASIHASNNTVVGFDAAFTFDLGPNNTIIGAGADAWGIGATNCVAIGAGAKCLADNQVRFGTAATTSIGGAVGFSIISDGRFKKNIQEKVKGIDFIMKLRPVTYQLDITGINRKLNPKGKTDDLSKKGMDENGKTIFSGFVAQEVEQAAKTTGYDFSGVDKPKNENDMYGLRYADFVVPLVKGMQEQQQMILELKKENADLQKRILALEKK